MTAYQQRKGNATGERTRVAVLGSLSKRNWSRPADVARRTGLTTNCVRHALYALAAQGVIESKQIGGGPRREYHAFRLKHNTPDPSSVVPPEFAAIRRLSDSIARLENAARTAQGRSRARAIRHRAHVIVAAITGGIVGVAIVEGVRHVG